MAGGLGIEPRYSESESEVLPLDDPPAGKCAPRDFYRLFGRVGMDDRAAKAWQRRSVRTRRICICAGMCDRRDAARP